MKPVFIVLLIAVIFLILMIFSFLVWKKSALKVMDEGKILETTTGTLHYNLVGKGPVLFFMHGGPGGVDQTFMLENLLNEGFSLLTVSRPGYLRTPFNPLSYRQQVDQYVELLDKLVIEKVVVMGYSAGGPLALNFANTYPERTYGLVMEAGVSTVYEMPEDQDMSSFWAKIFLSKRIQDLLSWISVISLKIAFKPVFKSIIRLETTLDSTEIKEFTDLVSHDKQRRKWMNDLIESTVPMSIRKLGLNHDVKLLTSIENIPVDQIKSKSLLVYSKDDKDVKWTHAEYLQSNLPDFELLETHGGHFMWIGKNMETIKTKRLEFLKSLEFE